MEIPREMRAARFAAEGRIAVEARPVPVPGPGQLLVAVRANALCGSERGQFQHGAQVTPGHEIACVVAAAGPGTTVVPGTPGVVFLMAFCGECRSCRLGLTNICGAKTGDVGFNRDGGYGGYALVGERAFFPLPPGLDHGEATLLLDVMGTGGHALERAALVHPDPQSLSIGGAGPMGLGVLAMARLRYGPDFPVVIADVVPYRLALAESLGGIPLEVAGRSLAEARRAAGVGATDLAVDTSGRGGVRQELVEGLERRGVLVCVGHGQDLRLDVSRDLIGAERAVLGSEYFRYGALAENLPLLLDHLGYLRQIITHRFGLDEIQGAFELFLGGASGKVVIEQP